MLQCLFLKSRPYECTWKVRKYFFLISWSVLDALQVLLLINFNLRPLASCSKKIENLNLSSWLELTLIHLKTSPKCIQTYKNILSNLSGSLMRSVLRKKTLQPPWPQMTSEVKTNSTKWKSVKSWLLGCPISSLSVCYDWQNTSQAQNWVFSWPHLVENLVFSKE